VYAVADGGEGIACTLERGGGGGGGRGEGEVGGVSCSVKAGMLLTVMEGGGGVKVVPGGEGGGDAVKMGGGGGLQAPAGLERVVAWVCSEVRPGASLAYIRSLSLSASLSLPPSLPLFLSLTLM
jgi:hypothetical protein